MSHSSYEHGIKLADGISAMVMSPGAPRRTTGFDSRHRSPLAGRPVDASSDSARVAESRHAAVEWAGKSAVLPSSVQRAHRPHLALNRVGRELFQRVDRITTRRRDTQRIRRQLGPQRGWWSAQAGVGPGRRPRGKVEDLQRRRTGMVQAAYPMK